MAPVYKRRHRRGHQRPTQRSFNGFWSTARTPITAISAGYSPLLTAAANGRLDIAKLLLAHGADPDAQTNDGKSALSLATERNHPEVAALFQARAAS